MKYKLKKKIKFDFNWFSFQIMNIKLIKPNPKKIKCFLIKNYNRNKCSKA